MVCYCCISDNSLSGNARSLCMTLHCLCVHPGCWLHFWKHSSLWSRNVAVIPVIYSVNGPTFRCRNNRFSRFQVFGVRRNEVDSCKVRISKCNTRDGAWRVTDCGNSDQVLCLPCLHKEECAGRNLGNSRVRFALWKWSAGGLGCSGQCW